MNYFWDKLHCPSSSSFCFQKMARTHTFDQQRRHLSTTVHPEAADRTKRSGVEPTDPCYYTWSQSFGFGHCSFSKRIISNLCGLSSFL